MELCELYFPVPTLRVQGGRLLAPGDPKSWGSAASPALPHQVKFQDRTGAPQPGNAEGPRELAVPGGGGGRAAGLQQHAKGGCSSRSHRPQKTTKGQAVLARPSPAPRPTECASLGLEREHLSHPPRPELDPAAPSGALSGPPLQAGSAGRRHCRAAAQPSSPTLLISRRAARVLVSGGGEWHLPPRATPLGPRPSLLPSGLAPAAGPRPKGPGCWGPGAAGPVRLGEKGGQEGLGSGPASVWKLRSRAAAGQMRPGWGDALSEEVAGSPAEGRPALASPGWLHPPGASHRPEAPLLAPGPRGPSRPMKVLSTCSVSRHGARCFGG